MYYKGYYINVVILDESYGVPGCVRHNSDDSYTIFIDASLNYEKQHEVFLHEIRHILGDDFSESDVQMIEMKGNGFRPSSYACTGKFQKNNCDNMNISDVNIGPFIINYIAAMVDASKKRKNIRNIDDLEQLILSHINFSDVIGISEESLRNTMDLFSAQTSSLGISSLSTQDQDGSVISQKNKLEEELQKTNRALERLKKAFLFDDDGISEKEFLEMKSKLEIDRIQIENILKKISQDSISANVNHIEFIKTASQFLMIHEINSGNFVDYKKLASADEKTMKDFISSVVSGITVLDKRIVKIVFRNGLSHTLLYR